VATLEGGDKLKAALAALAAKVSKPGTLNVGFLEGATYPDGTPVALVAFWNEFGTKRIPPRPFFRHMIAAESGHWGKDLGAMLLSTAYDVDRSLKFMGEEIKGELQQSIIDTNSPPNAPSTIARKGFSKTLIDTGHMQNSIDYEVKS
jgi:hypothetical protein